MVVLDASALLAFLHDEPGHSRVEQVLKDAVMGTVNWSEVIQKALARKIDVHGMADDFASLGLRLLPFTTRQAETAARLRETAGIPALSLADRACLALAIDIDAPLLTADRAWADLDLSVSVEVIR